MERRLKMQKIMQKKTILLNTHIYNSNPVVLQLLIIALSLLFIIIGALSYFENRFELIHGMYILQGAMLFLHGIFSYSKHSPIAPKITIDNDILIIKPSISKKKKQFKWEDISVISFHKYQINLKIDELENEFIYNASAANSVAAKKAIREMAESKGITVIGG